MERHGIHAMNDLEKQRAPYVLLEMQRQVLLFMYTSYG